MHLLTRSEGTSRALYPAPNRATPFANFVSSPVQADRDDRFDVRLDHLLNSRSSLAFRYSFGDRGLFEPFAGAGFSVVPGYGNDVSRRSQNAMISETHVFSPAFVNDLRFAFNRVASAVRQQNQGTSVNRAVGMPEPVSEPTRLWSQLHYRNRVLAAGTRRQ
jgi:hypothetical protein